MNLLELSKTIRELRKKQGMTVDALAKKSGFSKGFISQIENFRITPSLKALMRISASLGVSLEELFSGNAAPVKPYSFGNLADGELFDRDAGIEHGIHYLARYPLSGTRSPADRAQDGPLYYRIHSGTGTRIPDARYRRVFHFA